MSSQLVVFPWCKVGYLWVPKIQFNSTYRIYIYSIYIHWIQEFRESTTSVDGNDRIHGGDKPTPSVAITGAHMCIVYYWVLPSYVSWFTSTMKTSGIDHKQNHCWWYSHTVGDICTWNVFATPFSYLFSHVFPMMSQETSGDRSPFTQARRMVRRLESRSKSRSRHCGKLRCSTKKRVDLSVKITTFHGYI